jgi:hypothetical protein
MIPNLDDDGLDALMALAAPLPVDRRPAFVEAVLVAAMAEHGGELGPGVLNRVGRDQQRAFLGANPIPTREPGGHTAQPTSRPNRSNRPYRPSRAGAKG